MTAEEQEIGRKARERARAEALECPCCGALLGALWCGRSETEKGDSIRALLEKLVRLTPIEECEEGYREDLLAGFDFWEPTR